jgi:hypothetical protein
MIYRVRKQMVEEGSKRFGAAKCGPRRHGAHFDGEREAKLIALALLQAAKGPRALDVAAVGEQVRGTWHRRTRERFHDRAHTLKKRLKPHRRHCWVIPPKANTTFVAAMEDVLAVYMRPHDPDARWSAWMRPLSNLSPKRACRSR